MSAALKIEVYQAVQKILQDKAAQLQATATRLSESKKSESKSTAGDKHETGRAMMHLEEEKLARQVAETNKLTETLGAIDPSLKNKKAGLGALVQTNKTWFYLSVGLGKIEVNNLAVVVISLGSPIGHLLFGTEPGDEFTFNGNAFEVKSIF